MNTRLLLVTLLMLVAAPLSAAQPGAPGKPARLMTEQEIRDLLVWNSPWDSKSATPGQIYSYRTTFVMRRDELVAEVIRYATSERGDSIVNLQEGRVTWKDTTGADIAVLVEDSGELVGTAISKTTSLKVVFKPRP